MAAGEGWAQEPPAWALPVTVPGDLVLIREGGVVASVGGLCAFPMGFAFYLTISFKRDHVATRKAREPGGEMLWFDARTEEEREATSRMTVRLPGWAVADSLAYMSMPVVPGEPVLRFSAGDSGIQTYLSELRAESKWWVSPLPGPGQTEFSVFLHGAAEAEGTASMDTAGIIQAATRSQMLWPAIEPEPM
jgi:hypothetical protein